MKDGTGKMSVTFAIPDHRSNLRWSYDGEWANGLPHGTGVLENTDGSVFNGPLRDGAPHGFGTLCAGRGADSACVQMEFAAGIAIGEGTVVLGGRRYAVDCGDAGEDCFLMPRSAMADNDAAPSSALRFESMVELWQRVLPAAIEEGLVAPVSGGTAKSEL